MASLTTAISADPQHDSDQVTAPPRVLIVDPDPQARQRLEDLLTELDVGVTSTATGHDALVFALTASLDLILIDPNLSDMSGDRLIGLIRGSGSPVPIVLMSSEPPVVDAGAAPALSGYPRLSKPVELAELGTLVQDYLGCLSNRHAPQPVPLDDELASLQQRFLGSLDREYLHALLLALENQQPQAACAALHKLKGAAASFGYPELSRLAAAAEASLNHGRSLHAIKPSIDHLVCAARNLQ